MHQKTLCFERTPEAVELLHNLKTSRAQLVRSYANERQVVQNFVSLFFFSYRIAHGRAFGTRNATYRCELDKSFKDNYSVLLDCVNIYCTRYENDSSDMFR